MITQADTGLGTTFERWALNRVLARLQAETGLRTALEGPGDGMTGIAGINSLELGRRGVQVTLLLPDQAQADFAQTVWSYHAPQEHLTVKVHAAHAALPFGPGEFDLAWNFNVMSRQTNPEATLAELCRVSDKFVFICVPNRENYSFGLHRLHHQVARQPWEPDHGRVDLMHAAPWARLFGERGWKVREIIWLDCPWWPDIVDAGQLIADFFPFLKGLARRAKPENRFRWSAEALPYYALAAQPELQRRLDRLAYFENSRQVWLKRRFAHHVGILAEKC